MKKLLPILSLALVPTGALAQPQTVDANPALWVVKDSDTTIYLFGTYHMLDGKRDWFNDNVKTAFDASKELVMEAKMPENQADLQPLIAKYAVDQSGRTLSSRLDEQTRAKLHAALTGMGAPAAAFDPFEPWFASMSLAALKMQSKGMTGEHGPEGILSKAAAKAGMPVDELEGFEYQLKLFDSLPEEMQLTYLKQSLDELDVSDAKIDAMMNAWSSGDSDALAKLMNEGLEDHRHLYDMMFTKRNAAWAEWVNGRLDRPGTVFVAVGAGHLAGADSVQAFLAKKGIASQRVPN